MADNYSDLEITDADKEFLESSMDTVHWLVGIDQGSAGKPVEFAAWLAGAGGSTTRCGDNSLSGRGLLVNSGVDPEISQITCLKCLEFMKYDLPPTYRPVEPVSSQKPELRGRLADFEALKLERGAVYALEVDRDLSMDAMASVRAEFDKVEARIGVNLVILGKGFRIAPVGRSVKYRENRSTDENNLVCNNCDWRGDRTDLVSLGSIGRLHCPTWSEYGTMDGVPSPGQTGGAVDSQFFRNGGVAGE